MNGLVAVLLFLSKIKRKELENIVVSEETILHFMSL